MFGQIFNPQAEMIQVDIQAEEMGRNREIDLPVMSDVGALLRECNRIIRKKGTGEELKKHFSPWIASFTDRT